MNSEYLEILELLERARNLPPCPSQIELYEEAVRRSDAINDIELQFSNRLELISAAFAAGVADRMMNAISWCLAAFDKHPDRFPAHYLLWDCKHAMSYATSYWSISKEQVLALQQDVIKRYRDFGASLRPIYQFGCYNKLAMGDFDEAWEDWERSLTQPRDNLWDGPAWENLFRFEATHKCKSEQEALAIALPLLDGSEPSNEVTPWIYICAVEILCKDPDLLPLAQRCFRECYPVYKSNSKYLGHAARNMFFLTMTGNLSGAVELFERHVPWMGLTSIPPGLRLDFLRDSLFLMRQLQKVSPDQRIRIPPGTLKGEPEPVVRQLVSYFEKEMTESLLRFDQRNGNDSKSRQFEETLAMDRYIITDRNGGQA